MDDISQYVLDSTNVKTFKQIFDELGWDSAQYRDMWDWYCEPCEEAQLRIRATEGKILPHYKYDKLFYWMWNIEPPRFPSYYSRVDLLMRHSSHSRCHKYNDLRRNDYYRSKMFTYLTIPLYLDLAGIFQKINGEIYRTKYFILIVDAMIDGTFEEDMFKMCYEVAHLYYKQPESFRNWLKSNHKDLIDVCGDSLVKFTTGLHSVKRYGMVKPIRMQSPTVASLATSSSAIPLSNLFYELNVTGLSDAARGTILTVCKDCDNLASVTRFADWVGENRIFATYIVKCLSRGIDLHYFLPHLYRSYTGDSGVPFVGRIQSALYKLLGDDFSIYEYPSDKLRLEFMSQHINEAKIALLDNYNEELGDFYWFIYNFTVQLLDTLVKTKPYRVRILPVTLYQMTKYNGKIQLIVNHKLLHTLHVYDLISDGKFSVALTLLQKFIEAASRNACEYATITLAENGCLHLYFSHCERVELLTSFERSVSDMFEDLIASAQDTVHPPRFLVAAGN